MRWLFPDPVYGEIVPSKPTITIDEDLSKKYEPDYTVRANLGMYYFNPTRTLLRLRSHGPYSGTCPMQWIFNNGSYSGEIFAKHPEWFAYFMDKSQSKHYRGWENDKPQMRRQWWEYGNGWQICTTNPGTVEHAIKYALDYFKKIPML